MDKLTPLDSNNIYIVLQILIAASAAITILYKVLAFVFKKIQFEYRNLCKIRTMIEMIYAELTPNHNSSLKDKINKMELQLEENTKVTECIMYRQRWLLNNREEPIFESDINGECTWVNNKYSLLTGYTLDEFIKNGWHNVIHPEDRESVIKEWNAAIKDKRDSNSSHRIVCKTGSIYKVHVAVTRNAETGYIGTLNVEKLLDKN